MNPLSNNVPEYRLPTIDEIIDFSIDYIYSFKENEQKIAEGDEKLMLNFFLPVKSRQYSLRLFRPCYWHSLNYSNLPEKSEFKQEILQKDWVESYLQANLDAIKKYITL